MRFVWATTTARRSLVSLQIDLAGGSWLNPCFACAGVFDGHGAVGHEVAAFVSSELPAYFLKQKNLDSEPVSQVSVLICPALTHLCRLAAG